MAQLKSIIGSILRDIIYAQHEANLYAVSLGESYGKDGKARGFDLPNIMFSDIEMELRYAVSRSDDEEEQANISYSKFRKYLGTLCAEVARTAINQGISTVLYSGIERDEDDKAFFLHLKQDKELYSRFHVFLFKNLKNSFDSELYTMINGTDGKVNEQNVTDRLMTVIRSKFLNDTDLTTLFSGTDGKSLYKQCDEDILKAVSSAVHTQSDGKTFRKSKLYPRLDVEVSSSELEKLPSSAIQTFRFKFRPAETPPTLMDTEDDLDDFDMK